MKKALILVLIILLSMTSVALSQSLVVMATKIPGELPESPDSNLWGRVLPIGIPLTAQVMAIPRNYEPSVKEISLRALHNGKEVAFLMEWKDSTKDFMIDVDKFTDAAALQFPSAEVKGKPHFAMGDKDARVNIWHWKAMWQESPENEKVYATVDDFLGGVLAQNPISIQKTPIENIIASGFGSATSISYDESNIKGSGLYGSDTWRVVFKRAFKGHDKYDVTFSEGSLTPLAVAVWDGSNGERGGRKSVSTWYYVALETKERMTIFIYPIMALLGAIGLEAGIIVGIRKRKG
ncbi:MAG: hypothetical protein HY730_08185 [Candidatus Tectomicrobia bacterium]|uniref:Cytochrome c-552/DMSO reductase-like haem-binding domain-containing protein n=1 Tax=Tectimicrobiota bacterium TaxID=2528274 RepID=A0A933GMH9_UNCTE|nr:hypothetical protein [Candidatus Tectomicrobia bacterium]